MFDAVADDGTVVVAPVTARQAAIRLKRPAAGCRWPRNNSLPPDVVDGEQRCAGRLYGVDRPEPAGEREAAACHRSTCVMLANRAADGKHTAGACAATARDFVPVDGIRLGMCGERGHGKQEDCGQISPSM